MSKYFLLVIFLAVAVSWIYQPFTMDADDEMIDQYRSSFHKKPDLTPKDSVYAEQPRSMHLVNYHYHTGKYHIVSE